jgi:hypothetical protein
LILYCRSQIYLSFNRIFQFLSISHPLRPVLFRSPSDITNSYQYTDPAHCQLLQPLIHQICSIQGWFAWSRGSFLTGVCSSASQAAHCSFVGRGTTSELAGNHHYLILQLDRRAEAPALYALLVPWRWSDGIAKAQAGVLTDQKKWITLPT